MDYSPVSRGHSANTRQNGTQQNHGHQHHQHGHFSSFLRKKFFRSSKQTNNPPPSPHRSPATPPPSGREVGTASPALPHEPHPHGQVAEQRVPHQAQFPDHRDDVQPTARQQAPSGRPPAGPGVLRDDQSEKVREFKKAVRHFKHQLECSYAAQTQTLQQMKTATEALPEEIRGPTLQQYIQEYAEALGEHLRVKRTPPGLEQYESIQTLGHGGFGAVYLVRRKSDGQYFALKQVPKRKVLKASSRERQFAERNFLSACKCPSIVQLHVTFQDELFLYQVVEFLQGGSLMHYMHAKQKFPEEVVKFCIAELVLAVKEVHEKNYIHRDIKPDNIVFTRDGHLKLLDFGLAKFAPHVFHFASYSRLGPTHCCARTTAEGEAHAGIATTTASTAASPHPIEPGCGSDHRLSSEKFIPGCHAPHFSSPLEEGCCECVHMQDGEDPSGEGQLNRPSDTLLRSICGTPMYTAPEVLRGEGYDHSVDWWSVGVVMFEMLYGGIPFCPPPKYRGDVATFVKVQVTNHTLVCPIPYPSPISSVLSPESINFMQGLVCEPEQRFKSAAKIMQHPWFAGVQWDTVHNLKSPLCADTEFYAQRHFPRIVQPGTADSEEGDMTSRGTQRKPNGDPTNTANNKPKLGAPVPLDKCGTSRAAVRPPSTNVGAEHDLFFSRYEYNRRAVETLPTFHKILQRSAEKLTSPKGCTPNRIGSQAPSHTENSSSNGATLFSASGGHHSATVPQTGPSSSPGTGLCTCSPENKRCAGLNAAEPDETPPSPAVTEGDCCVGSRKDDTRERTKDTTSETHPVTVNMGAGVDGSGHQRSSSSKDHNLSSDELVGVEKQTMCVGPFESAVVVVGGQSVSKGKEYQMDITSPNKMYDKKKNTFLAASSSSSADKKQAKAPAAGVSGTQGGGCGWLPSSHRGEALHAQQQQTNMMTAMNAVMQDSADHNNHMSESFPSVRDQAPTSSSSSAIECMTGEGRTTAIGTRGRQACEPSSPLVRH
ncbi:agc kinase [Cystoisospora suis]|uniref:non-specific serine/threonine protein kinase n=1 Tax=Cystoisospora suis TaxID=483139 RepID=A0A2C6L1U3_9APIC|nr:agc kinase [Cystoisospora suis]